LGWKCRCHTIGLCPAGSAGGIEIEIFPASRERTRKIEGEAKSPQAQPKPWIGCKEHVLMRK
jgi:hypothetical protein